MKYYEFLIYSISTFYNLPVKADPGVNKMRIEDEVYKDVLDCFPLPVLSFNVSNLCDYVNKKCLDVTGVLCKNALGEGWILCFHEDDRQICRQSLSYSAANEAETELECRLNIYGNKFLWVRLKLSPVYDSKKVFKGMVGTTFPIADNFYTDIPNDNSFSFQLDMNNRRKYDK